MRAEDGSLDPEKVTQVLGAVAKEHANWLRPLDGGPQGVRESVDSRKPSFGETVKRQLLGG